MSSLSGGSKDRNISFIKIILYQSQFCQNSFNIKNYFPYGISFQFDKFPEKYIDSIKNINEIFDHSKTEFKYIIYNIQQKHLIKINCYNKSISSIKNIFASVQIAVNPNSLNNFEKNIRKWYYLKNKKGEVFIKLLLSIDLYNIQNDSNYYANNENEFNNNILIKDHKNINLRLNSISNNNLNGIQSSTYISTSHYISSSNISLKSSSSKTNNSNISYTIINPNNILYLNNKINKNNEKANLLTSIVEKDDSMTNNENDSSDKYGEFNSNNLNINIKNLIKKTNQKLFIKSKNLIQSKQNLNKEENKFLKKKKEINDRIIKFKNDIKILDKKKQMYENKYLDFIVNYNQKEKKFYKSNLEKDINSFEKDILYNINNIYINQKNLDEILLGEKMNKNYFCQYQKTIKEIEKSIINNYYNKGYSFESNNFKHSLLLYGNEGNSYKKLYNINTDNKIFNNNNNSNFKPSPIRIKYHRINKEYSISISNSNSPCSEKCDSNFKTLNNNNSNKNSRKRMITNYSKSTLNILEDLIIFDEILEINKNKASKSNDILKNNLEINIDGISNIKINNHKNKETNAYKKNKQKNKKIYHYNLFQNKIKKYKIRINDDNNNSYYHLEDKYLLTTITNNKLKNKDINSTNKKLSPKIFKIGVIKKDLDIKKFSQNWINNNVTKNSNNSIKIKENIGNNTINKDLNYINIKNNFNNKNILDSKKPENQINNKFQIQRNNSKKNNRVIKNIFLPSKDKNTSKRKKNNIANIEILDNNKSINSSTLRIESIFPKNITTTDHNKFKNSRYNKYIQYYSHPNNNLKSKSKKNKSNYVQLNKKKELNNKQESLINHFYYSNDSYSKIKNINRKISFNSIYNIEIKKEDINIDYSSRIINKNNTFNKNKTNERNLTNKKISNIIKVKNNINKKPFLNKKSNFITTNKNTTNIESSNSKISFYNKKSNTINEGDNTNQKIIKNKLNNNKIFYHKNLNESYQNRNKNNKNEINKTQIIKNNQYLCLINNSNIKPMFNSSIKL